MVPLKNTADVFGGIRPPTHTDSPMPCDPLGLVQPKDLTREGIQWDQLPPIAANPNSKHLLRAGDVLVLLRGTVLRSLLIQSLPPSPVVVSNHIAIVRSDAQRMLPGYLVSILNHPTTRQRARTRASGTTIPFLSIKSLKEMEIPLPSIEQQTQIARIDRLRQEFRQLSEKKIRLASRLVDALIQQGILEGRDR